MITITNKGRAVKLVEDEVLTLPISGKQIIQLNKNVTIPAYSKVEFDTKLQINVTNIDEECIIGEYLLDEESPLCIVCEPYDLNWDVNEPVILPIYNTSAEDITLNKGDYIAFIGQYHRCQCTETSDEFLIGATGLQILYTNGSVKVLGDELVNYSFEELQDDDGEPYIKIKEIKGE